MDASCVEFLDDTSVSQPIHSPFRTSTVAKENIKWNEDAFFNRHNLTSASESLFLPLTESHSDALTDPASPRKSLQNLKFPLNNSFISDGTNSSLGILHVENFELSDSSFHEPIKFEKKQKSKKKLQRSTKACHEEKNCELKEKDFVKKPVNEPADANINKNMLGESENGSDSNSSDIEYDGTNIPELNMDCDILSLLESKRASASRVKSPNNTNESAVSSVDLTKNISKECNNSQNSFYSSQLTKDELFKNDSTNRENSVNVRKSIFENFHPLYGIDSLYDQIVSEKKSEEKKNTKIPETIKVCPFLGMGSFEVEPILSKQNQPSIYPDIENTRCSQSLSVDFCPDQISARSSSFKSSRQFDSSPSLSKISSFNERGTFSLSVSPNQFEKSQQMEDLENEGLSGSHFQISENKLEFPDGGNESIEDKDSGFPRKSSDFEMFSENISNNESEFGNLAFQSDLEHKNLSGFVSEGENWCSRLGISESEFFSSEAAKEILKKDKEAFEKEQMSVSPNLNKVSSVSNWSVTNQHEITPPSWFSGTSPDQKESSDRHVSIGTLIGARSENLGYLSEDSQRERPYFGKLVSTPPKNRPSNCPDPFAWKTSIGANSEDNSKKLRISALSEFLDDISTTDPMDFASKIVERCTAAIQNESKKHISNQNVLNSKIKFQTSEHHKDKRCTLSDIEESESTLVRSISSSNLSKRTDIDADSECKSTTSEPAQCLDNSLNYSVGSSCERESIKTSKSDTCSNCSAQSSQHNASQKFSRPTSSCSSACNIPLAVDNALSLQYGSMKYLNSCTGSCQNCFHNINFLQQAGNSGLPCPHVCAHHALQSNMLSASAPNSLQSVIQNALSGPLVLSGTSASFLEIQVPSELTFPEKIALGDSQEMNLTIRNSGNIGCYYQISCASAYLNESPLPFEMSGLSCKNTVPSSVGGTTDIKLILAPKYSGNIEVNLQIDAFLSSVGQTLNATPVSSAKTKINYEVVRPSVTMWSKGKDTLNLGQVVAGSTFVEYITVTNNCEVSVPLRISLSNDSSENQIYFGLKEMDRQKHPSSGALRFLSPKVLLYRIPASKCISLPSSFDIPIVFESINGRVDSTVTAAIETPTLSEVLAFIKISACSGDAKLVLKDPNQNPLILKAAKGATYNHSVTVMNAGNLCVVYDIHIDGDNDVLSVSPNSLNLQPKECATISVTFTPSTYHTVKGNLLAAVEPHGQVFTVTEIIGQVKENSIKSHHNNLHSSRPTKESTRPTRDFAYESSNLIECNKKFLDWGGADIDETWGVKTCTIRNTKQEAVKVKLFIKTQEFLLIDDSGYKTSSYEVTLKAKEEKLISVAFMPKKVISYAGLLCIKPLSEKERRVFSIPLSGYGGTSKIKVLDLPDGERTGYYLDVDAPVGTDIVRKNITLQNVGFRPAFVKLFLTYDGFVQNVAETQTGIYPSEFVLLENETKNILVSINCMEKKVVSSNEVISILYGDEIMRQRLNRKLQSSSSKNQNLGFNINFNVPYDGEEKVPYDPLCKPSSKDESLFHTHLKKLMIHIFFNGQNTSFSRTSFAALSEVEESLSNLTLTSTTSLRRLTMESHSPPVKESIDVHRSRLSLPIPFNENPCISEPLDADSSLTLISDSLHDLKLNSWTVQPEELIIYTDNKDKRILLRSDSNSDLRFKVEWTIDVITVSPTSGILPANKEIGLRLTVINTNHNKLLDDYQGNIRILCDGIEKNVRVKVLKDHKKARCRSPVPATVNESLSSGFIGDSFCMNSTLMAPLTSSVNIENIYSFPKEIYLQKTMQGCLSETVLTVTNATKSAVNWNIHPTTILFTEPFDDSIDSACPAIEFHTASGTFKPLETKNIVIKFLPRSAAYFFQFFELVLNSEDSRKQTNTIKVQGHAVADFPAFLESRNFEIKDTKQAVAKKRVTNEIFSENELCVFPTTASGQKSTQSLTLKNISDKHCKLTVLAPKQPFILNYSSVTIKSRKFLTVPVHFTPLRPGHYESEVKFVCENGNEIRIKLNGLCSAQ